MEHLHIINVLVRNHSGVLQRITGLFSRRGYNIQSLYAEQTPNPEISRIIIEVAGDDGIISQVKKQLTKLVDVLSINQVSNLESEIAEEQPLIRYKNAHAVSEITLLDTTLRDGAQSDGITFTLADKLAIVKALDQLGIPLIEAGSPGESRKDLEFFEEAKKLNLKHAQLVAFGGVAASDTDPASDRQVKALLEAGTKTVTLFGKCWKCQLDTTPEQNRKAIGDTIRYLIAAGKTVILDAGHYFDGYADDPDYALSILREAVAAGAGSVVLCDTNGGAEPQTVYRVTKETAGQIDARLGIHCHDDMGCAVANSLMAIDAGASHLQGTYTGLGERCGNANLSALIPTLQLKRGLHCISQENLKRLTSTALLVNDVANVSLSRRAPYVGKSAFAHKSETHVNGVERIPTLFEHIDPEAVGNKRSILVSELGGKSALFTKVRELFPDLDRDSPEAETLMTLLSELEGEGYQFEAAPASMELAMLKKLGRFIPFFELVSFKIMGDYASSSAVVKIRVGEETEISAQEGAGPIHALDLALRKGVQRFYPELGSMKLTDYKVRVIDPKGATAAKGRVLIESTDGDAVWTTVGVSDDVIRASLSALVDSIEYKLWMDSRKEEELA